MSGALAAPSLPEQLADDFMTYQTLSGIEPLLAGLGTYGRLAALCDGTLALLRRNQLAAAELLIQQAGLREIRA